MTVELAVAAAAVAAYRQLEDALARHLGRAEAAHAAQRVTAGTGPPALDPAMSRSVFGGPSWTETGPVPVVPGGGDRHTRQAAARADLERRLRRIPAWRRVRLLTGQVVDVRMHVLRRLTAEATAGLLRREQVKAAVLLLGGEVRRVHLEAGRRLAAAGHLIRATDVDLLRTRELYAGLDHRYGPVRCPPPAELDRRRRWIRQWEAEPPLPDRFVGVPGRPVPGTPPAGDRLAGWGASPGRHTGRARVVTDPATARLEADEVLVATATDAGWTPLLLRAGAIVVERGGPLSHAAILARELGIPAVLNLAGATTALAGHTVTVDGDAGLVVIHPDGGPP